MSGPLDQVFLERLIELHTPASDKSPRLKWYLTVILAFGGMNYPELIPDFYKLLLEEHIPEDQQKSETAKLKEGLTKVCGIWGAAKVGARTCLLHQMGLEES